MLRNVEDLENCSIRATDGEIGQVKDFYFDDDAWAVRYLVVETGTWLSSRKVLISPIALGQPDWLARTLPVNISQAQVRNSPNIDTDQPVSRQNEEQLLGYYSYPSYWGGEGLWGEGLYPYAMAPGFTGVGIGHVEREREMEAYLRAERERHRNDDPHLRSCNAVTGYRIHASDGEIGRVSGFLVDDESWALRYLIIDTSNWWIGHLVLVAPSWISGVHWQDRTVSVNLTREAIKTAPAYDPSTDWTHEQDTALYSHHGRSGLWKGSSTLDIER